MRRSTVLSSLILASAAGLLLAAGPDHPATTQAAGGATTKPTTDPADDPRPGLAAFYDAIGKGDEAAAFSCWCDDCQGDAERAAVEDLVRHLDREMIATAKLEAAIRLKLPVDYETARKDGNLIPEREQLLACNYTAYRRLAVCKWGDGEDDGLPMVLDNSGLMQGKPSVWKISMQQWHETTKSSVGDPMLLSEFGVKAKDLTTRDVLAGKYKTADEVEEGFFKHMKQVTDAEDAAEHAATTKPAR